MEYLFPFSVRCSVVSTFAVWADVLRPKSSPADFGHFLHWLSATLIRRLFKEGRLTCRSRTSMILGALALLLISTSFVCRSNASAMVPRWLRTTTSIILGLWLANRSRIKQLFPGWTICFRVKWYRPLNKADLVLLCFRVGTWWTGNSFGLGAVAQLFGPRA